MMRFMYRKSCRRSLAVAVLKTWGANMQSSNLLKVLAAFAAGIVVALGSALVYVRVSENVHSQPVAPAVVSASQQPASAVLAADPAPPEQSTETPPTQAAPVAAAPEPAKSAPPVHVKKHKAARAPVKDLAAEPPAAPAPPAPKRETQIAQNKPPAVPAATAPAVNEPSSAPGPESAPAEAQPEQAPAPAPPPPPQPHVVTLPAGMNVVIRLGETISTDHNYSGDTFRGTLDAPIIMEGFIIADRGSKVLGRVVDAEKPGRIRGVGNLSLTLAEINTTDGQRVSIATNSVEKRGVESRNQDAAKIAGGAALGAIIGAIAAGGKGAAVGAGLGGAAGTGTVLATRGKAAELPVESRLTFQISSPVTITEKLK